MAKANFYGVDDLIGTLEKMAEIPDDVKAKALTEAAKIVAAEQKRIGEEKGVRDPESNVHILDKIKINKPKIKKTSASVTITFSGSRKRGNTKTRNAEIAFINEFGSKKRNIQPRPFVSVAIEKVKDKAIAAADDVINNYYESIR